MKRHVLKAACNWGAAFVGVVLVLELFRLLVNERSMFGFHSIHLIWLMILGERAERIIRDLPSFWHGIPVAKFCVVACGLAFFGSLGARPLTGDWDADGLDTIGVFNSNIGVMGLNNTNTSGNGIGDLSFSFGQNGDVPLAGDWDGLP